MRAAACRVAQPALAATVRNLRWHPRCQRKPTSPSNAASCPIARRRTTSAKSAPVATPAARCSTSPTTGTAARSQVARRRSRPSGAAATSRSASAACGGFTSCCRSPRPSKIVTIGEGQTLLQPSDGVGQYVGMQAGQLVPAVRGHEPLGQLQRQRHDGRLHARPHDRRQAGPPAPRPATPARRWPCTARVTQADEGGHLHRLGQDLLRQAVAGARLRRADGADRRRLRRRHGTASRRSASKLGIYLVNSVNPFRLEGQKTIMFRVLEGLRWEVPDWIVVPGGNLGNSQRVRQGVSRAARARPDRPHAAAGRHQRRRRRHALRAVRAARPALERRPARRERSSTTTTPSSTPPIAGPSTIASAIEINRPVNLHQVPAGARSAATAWSAK